MSRHDLELSTYPRRAQFDYFRSMAQPYVGVTVEMDITDLWARQQREGRPFFLTILYLAGTAANHVPQLRQRVRGDGIVAYDRCDTSHTVERPDGTYCYCHVPACLPFRVYLPLAMEAHQAAKAGGSLTGGEGGESPLFVSSLPWISYTALVQPTPFPADSNPRITFGGYHWAGERLLLPVTLLANHAGRRGSPGPILPGLGVRLRKAAG